MGRCGTSALARVLSLCGGDLPERLMGANLSNPTGHWEPMAAVEINEAIFATRRSSWFDSTFLLQFEGALDEEAASDFRRQMTEFLRAAATGSLLIIKEPRITALAPLWFDAAREANLVLKVIVPIRHPAEVAASLEARDGLSPELSGALWLKYNLLAERYSRDLPRVFVKFSDLLADWEQQIARISQALDVNLFASDKAAIESFIDRDLHHQQRTDPPTEVLGLRWLGPVYKALAEAAAGLPCRTDVLDEIFREYRTAERAFRNSLDESRLRAISATDGG